QGGACWSGRSEPPPDATRGGSIRGCRFAGGFLARSGQSVKSSTGPILTRRNFGIFPAALEQPHLLQAPERAIQGAVGRQQLLVGDVAETFRELVSMELFDAGSVQTCGCFADRIFERDQGAGFSAHTRL